MFRTLAPLFVALVLAACVESDAPEVGSAAQPLTSYCLETVSAVAPAPPPSPIFFLLPPNAIEQLWLMVPDAVEANNVPTYSLFQVSAKTRTVTWRTHLTAGQRPLALALVGTRPGAQVSIRNPPPPPPPDGNGWAVANFAVAIAAHVEATSSIEWDQGPQ